jgi:hypothetical protein
MRKQRSLELAAQRAGQRSFFVASDLQTYRSLHRLGDEELAQWLGCPHEELLKLALCRRPNSMASSFREEVERIATYTRSDKMRLAHLFREVDAQAALQSSEHVVAEGQGFLIAARDQDEKNPGNAGNTAGDAPDGGTGSRSC